MNKKRALPTAVLLLSVTLLASSCTPAPTLGATTAATAEATLPTATTIPTATDEAPPTGDTIPDLELYEDFSAYDMKTACEDTATTVTFTADGCDIVGDGAYITDNILKITSGGDYIISGKLKGGAVRIHAPGERVHLVLSGLSILSYDEPAIYVGSAEKVIITLRGGTENIVEDTVTSAIGATETHKACVYSREDLTINGTGSLTVRGCAKNGITCKGTLRVLDATLTLEAANNALKADSSILLKNGKITATASGDGIKVSDDPPDDKGYIYINGGIYTVITGDDALQADSKIIIASGSVTTITEGKAINAPKSSIADGCLIKK